MKVYKLEVYSAVKMDITVENLKHAFVNKEVLITGGLGFIGSALANKLVELGANVSIIDALIPEYGGNLFNIEPIKDKLKQLTIANITDEHAVEHCVKNKDFIFHCAGQVSHVQSQKDNGKRDVDFNINGTLNILDACKKNGAPVKIIYTGTRGEYGRPKTLPVTETFPVMPQDKHESTKLVAGQFILQETYKQGSNIKGIHCRLTNIYGPRGQMKSKDYCVLNWFVRKALNNEEIQVFGDGSLLRDWLYIDDCVEAMLLIASNEDSYGHIFNIGHHQGWTFLETVKTIIESAESGSWKFAPFSQERANQNPGSFITDISKTKQFTGLEPRTDLTEGIKKTVEYYKKFREKYW